MQTLLLIVAGAIYVSIVIGVSRLGARFLARYIPGVHENFVYAFSLIATAHQYVTWAQAGATRTDVSVEVAGLAVFGALALAGLKWPNLLAAGWLLHAGWDWALHPMPETTWVPFWFPDLCVGYDVVLAGYIAAQARAVSPRAVAAVRAGVAALVACGLLMEPPPVFAQEHDHGHHAHGLPSSDEAAAREAEPPPYGPFFTAILHHAGSGTSIEPPSSPIPMLMGTRGPWMWMVHGNVFVTAVEQNSPASRDRVFSNNWLMPMAGRRVGRGLFTVRTMVSLEPATSRYTRAPEPYQAAHDVFMEIAAAYDLPISRDLMLSFYGAPVGEPALGPSAFMHRLSALENPLLPLSHTTQDSTHQSRDVLTAGLAYKNMRVEVSGFHGRGPDADRLAIEQGPIDSWSARLTVSPARNWSLQVSGGHLTSPDRAFPTHDLRRLTASASYTRPLANGFWASTVSWGRDTTLNGEMAAQSSYLAETTLKSGVHSVWGRIETANRFLAVALPTGHVHRVGGVESYTAGFAHEIRFVRHIETALGIQVTAYRTPAFAAPVFGSRPTAVAMFLRLRPNAH